MAGLVFDENKKMANQERVEAAGYDHDDPAITDIDNVRQDASKFFLNKK